MAILAFRLLAGTLWGQFSHLWILIHNVWNTGTYVVWFLDLLPHSMMIISIFYVFIFWYEIDQCASAIQDIFNRLII